ncbi:hypothetical protein DV735_g322, partial [Chaetothyriales sp. CBS 134920]
MPTVLLRLLPYHLLLYGTLLGMQFYQSFVNTKICYRHLSMPQFQQLQKHLFPVYFDGQLALALLTVATHPPLSLVSLARDVPGVVSLAIVLLTDVLNWSVFGPKTLRIMVDRAVQEAHDGRGYRVAEGMSAEMQLLNRQFSHNHAMAIHLNAISMVATVFYGFRLAARLKV